MAEIRAFTMEDYSAARALWERSPGVGLNESDEPDGIAAFLLRNPGMSAVALQGEEMVGAVLCGNDGRRGYLHHLAVDSGWQGQGIAKALIAWSAAQLLAAGIDRCNIFLYADNEAGSAFWNHNGWRLRPELRVLQKVLRESP